MTYEDYKSKVIAAQEQWNTERAKIYERQTAGNYSTIFGGDTQPPHITVADNYDNMTLEQMQAAVAAMKPKIVDDAVTAWANIGGALMGTFIGFNQQFARTITGANGHSGWTGAAASAAVTAVNNYAQQSIPLSQAATAISLKLTEMRTGLEQTQALMPGLTERANVTGKSLPADGVMKVDDHNRTEATEEARRILRSVYSQVAAQTDVGVPFLPTAPTIASGDGDGGGPGSNGDTNTGGSQGSSNGGTTAGNPSTGEPGGGTTTEEPNSEPAATSPQSTEAASTTPQSSTASPQSSTPTASTPTAATPTTPAPTVGTPSTSRPGGGATAGRGGSTGGGTGGRGGSAASPATPGKTAPGSPAAAAAAAAAGTRAGTSAGGGRGAAGMGGMGAPGARGGSDDERTKGIPDYLITQENGELLLGTNEIRTVPPVIGGDNDSAPS